MSRTSLSVVLSCLAALLGLLTALLWNRNYASAAECDALQREIERLRVENERLEIEVLEHELLPPEPLESAGLDGDEATEDPERGRALAAAGGGGAS